MNATRLRLASAFACLFLLAPSLHAEGLSVHWNRMRDLGIDLSARSDLYLGAPAGLGIEEAASPACADRFSPVAGRMIWTGKGAPATWLRFRISADELAGKIASENPERPSPATQWILEARPSFSIILDHVDLFIPLKSGGYERISAGTMAAPRPFETRSRFFIFELPPDAFEGQPCYLRISSTRDVKVDFLLEPALAHNEGLEYAAYGIIYGILLATSLYGIFLFFALGDGTYLWYALYALSAGAWLFLVQGHAKALIGQHPGLDQSLLWAFAGTMLASGAIFTSEFLGLREKHKKLFALYAGACALALSASTLGIIGMQDYAFIVSNGLGLVLPMLISATAVIRIREGVGQARFFLAGWLVLVAGSIVFSLMGLKVLPVNFLTVNCMAIALAVESVFLALALSDRFRRLEFERKRLERSQAQYRELSLTDVLTGLRNKRCLSIEINEAMELSRTRDSPLALIFLDIDNFKNVNDSYGHALGDEVLAALARSIRGCIRDEDIPCRYGGEEFVIVMPDTRLEDAFRVAERIREHFESTGTRQVDGESVTTTVSLGVTQFLAGETAETLITRADDAMYEAKRAGKNRSVVRRA